MLNVDLGNRFFVFGFVFELVFCFVFELMVLVEGVDFTFADGLDFRGYGLDEGEVEELGHDFSFVFPWLSL